MIIRMKHEINVYIGYNGYLQWIKRGKSGKIGKNLENFFIFLVLLFYKVKPSLMSPACYLAILEDTQVTYPTKQNRLGRVKII